MIMLTKLNGVEFVLNCDLIESIHENPDTTIKLSNGTIYIVEEKMREIIRKVIEYRKNIFTKLPILKENEK